MSTPADYVGLGPCVHDPAWVKMSSPSPPIQKKKKKIDSKPQSQINKCLNEKRRREKENAYIEELAELIQASFCDMTSTSAKPDKCAILQQTVDQIREIKARDRNASPAVQQGEVSSSGPVLVQKEAFSHLILQALDGFLFVVSLEGRIEFVSDNVEKFINFDPEDLHGKLIYNIIHAGDHTKFSSNLLPLGWPDSSSGIDSKSRSFSLRLLIKSPDVQEEGMEEKPQRISKYEPMQIFAVLSNHNLNEKKKIIADSEDENHRYLVCIARRIPSNEPQGTSVEQFTTKFDRSGIITDIDTSGVSSAYSHLLNKDLINKKFCDICHPSDLKKLTGLLKETQTTGHSTSQVYRLKFGLDCCIHIQSKCKYFKHDPEDFIMATHSIISSFQEGTTTNNSGSTTSKNSIDSGTSMTRTASQERISSPTSDNSRQLRLLLTQMTTDGTGTETVTAANDPDLVVRSEVQQQQENRILKHLLDQKDEEESISSPNANLLNRMIPSMMQQSQPNHISQQNNKNTSNDNMLRDLLNERSDEDDEMRIKKEEDPFCALINEDFKEENVIKQEFSSPARSPYLPTPSSFGFTPRPTSRPSSTDLNFRGIKRPSDEPHDGNPSKQTVMGGFERLLDGSPPTSAMSPMSTSMGNPTTPLGRPTTPHGRPITPHGRPNTPHGRPITPHTGPQSSLGGPGTPHGPPTTFGPPTPLGHSQGMMMASMNSSLSPSLSQQEQHLQHPMTLQQQQQQSPLTNHQQQNTSGKSPDKNKMLLQLLSIQQVKQAPSGSLKPRTSPYALPQEKLPKNLNEKLNVSGNWTSSSSTVTSISDSSSSTEILNKLLRQPPTSGRLPKNNAGVNMIQRQSSNPGDEMLMVQHGGVQQQQHPQMQKQSAGPGQLQLTGNVSFSTNSGPINTSSGFGLMSTVTTTTTALPNFSESMGLTVFGAGASPSYSNGRLPSIALTTFPQDQDLDNVLESLLDIEAAKMGTGVEAGGLNCSLDDIPHVPTSSPFDVNKNFAIQQIKNKLMSEDFDAQSSSGSYGGVAQSTVVDNYPPPYNPRSRFPTAGSNVSPMLGNSPSVATASVMRHTSPQFSPGSPVMQSRQMPGNPRMQQQQHLSLQQQDHNKRLQQQRQQQQHQVIISSSTNDTNQSSPSYQNFDELMSPVASNINVSLQRNPSDSQASTNYGMIHSPLGSAPPSQRIVQPPFSPHGPISSPLSNSQQYSNNSSLGQMGSYQNNQNSQLSPRLSQGSPAPPTYPSGGALLPQVSPTGPTVPQGQQSPAWSGSSPQHRASLQQQTSMMNMMSQGNRSYSGASRNLQQQQQLPSIRSLQNQGARQAQYSLPSGNTDMSTFSGGTPQQSGMTMYQQQQQQQLQQQPQQYRLARNLSAPGGQMPPGDSSNWPHDVSQSNISNIVPSPRDDNRGSGGEKEKSMLKKLLSQ